MVDNRNQLSIWIDYIMLVVGIASTMLMSAWVLIHISVGLG